MSGRSLLSAKAKYGFNGQEKDNEISGEGNSNTAEYWQYDIRLGRRWNLDPVPKYWESSYSCFSNNSIINIDPLGNTDYYSNKGRFIGSDGVDNGIKSMALSNKTSKEIKKELDSKKTITMEGRDIINAPSVSEVSAMRTAWTKTENGVSKDRKSGHEEGFVSGGGTMTESKSGQTATLPNVPELPELNMAILAQNNDKNAPTNLIVHTHPDLIDGGVVIQGTPSSADFENAKAVDGILKKEVTYATIGTQKTYDKESNSVNTSPVKVTFYGSKGVKGSIELKKLEKAVKKIESGKK